MSTIKSPSVHPLAAIAYDMSWYHSEHFQFFIQKRI